MAAARPRKAPPLPEVLEELEALKTRRPRAAEARDDARPVPGAAAEDDGADWGDAIFDDVAMQEDPPPQNRYVHDG